MAGFEFSPSGIVPMGQAQSSEGTAFAITAAPPAPVQTLQTGALGGIQNVGPSVQQPTIRNMSAPLAPRQVVKWAKARVREINTELKKLKALAKERDELQRLLAAAKNKAPRAIHAKVSSITRANAL